jgi:hypothetical protein
VVKQLLTLLFTFVLAFPLATTTLAQEVPAKAKPAKEAREGGPLGWYGHQEQSRQVYTDRS